MGKNPIRTDRVTRSTVTPAHRGRGFFFGRSVGHVVTWSRGHVVIRSRGHTVIRGPHAPVHGRPISNHTQPPRYDHAFNRGDVGTVDGHAIMMTSDMHISYQHHVNILTSIKSLYVNIMTPQHMGVCYYMWTPICWGMESIPPYIVCQRVPYVRVCIRDHPHRVTLIAWDETCAEKRSSEEIFDFSLVSPS